MFNLGFGEMLLLAAIALIFIGPKELPQMARILGRIIRELRNALNDVSSTMTKGVVDDATLKNPLSTTDQKPPGVPLVEGQGNKSADEESEKKNS